MGSFASKSARRLPKHAEPPAWVGKRTANPAEPPTGVKREQVRDRLASEHRTEAIEKDARDPDFLANLNRLGPVRVDHHMKPIRTGATNTAELFKSRKALEEELDATDSPRVTHDKLYASTLSQALDARKGVRNKTEMSAVADRYEVRLERLESVARFVNSPSVGKGAGIRRVVDKDGNETMIMKAIWVEPPSVEAKSSAS